MEKQSIFDKIGIYPKQILYLLMAHFCYSLSLDLFYVHHGIAAGGLSGIGTVLYSMFNLPVGLMVFVLNIPICIWGLTVKGKKFIFTALISTGIFSLAVDLLAFLPSVTEDKLVAVICGGILYGVAASLSVKAQISSGGTDLLAKLVITKLPHVSLGSLLMCIDGSIVVLATLAYGEIESGIYAVLAIAVASLVTDKINSGFSKADMFYIFANRNLDKISDAILYDMGRGATCLTGVGMYAGTERKILIVVVKPSEMPKLKSIVRKYDPSAFIILTSAFEIVGNGFEGLNLTETIHDNKENI